MRMLMCAHKYVCHRGQRYQTPPEMELCELAECVGPVRVLGIELWFSEKVVCALSC